MTKALSFETEPLTENLLRLKQMQNPLMAQALNTDITPEFMKMLTFKIDHRQLINMDCMGKVRTGKSLAMISLCMTITDYTKMPFKVEDILHNGSEYLNVLKTGLPNSIYLIDETEVSDAFGIGANAEYYQGVDVMRICAKKLLHRINLVGAETMSSNNADYVLQTLGIDYEHFATKLLVIRIERGLEIPMGYIVVPVSRVLCDDIKSRKQYGCLGCPKYDTAECNTFLKAYEKKKDLNIKRIAEENFNFRGKIRLEIAEKLLKNPGFTELTKKSEQLVYVRNISPRYTNRTLTEKEYEEIVTLARMGKKDKDIIAEMRKNQGEYKSPDGETDGEEKEIEGENDDRGDGREV